MPAYLGTFDIGTTGVKAGILGTEGRLVATAYREYSVMHPHSQWSEQSVDEIWRAQCAASREVLEKAGIAPADVAAIGISCQRATFVPLDEHERPLTNFIGWQDKRSIEQCETMERLVGSERYYRIAGLPIEPTAAVSKILWLKEHAPDVFERTATFASTQNVHLHQLGAEHAPCDLPDAAYMGLLDVDRFCWSEELLGEFGIPSNKMPALVHSGTVVGCVSRAAAELTGFAEGTPLVAAGGDLQMGALGSGVARPGLVSVAMGTGAGVIFHLARPLRHPDRAMGCLPHGVKGAWEMEGICLASGAAYKWFRDTLGQVEQEEAARQGVDPYVILNDEAAKAAPGCHGLIVMPSFMGAGAPYWYPKARGAILGLTLSTERQELVRATLEGVCLELRAVIESAEKVGAQINEVHVWGGAAKSPFWNQLAADIYGVPVVTTAIGETGMVGAGICAGVGARVFRDAAEGVEAMVRVADRYEPDLSAHARYDELFGIYQSIYHALVQANVWERIAALDVC
jgi:xylulokinase